MRLTFAVYLEMALDARLPGFFEGIQDFEFCKNLDRGDFREREEIFRVELENVTDENYGQKIQVVHRAASRLMLGHLRRVLDRPELDQAEAEKIASVSVLLVENAKNDKHCHGMSGPNPSVLCPKCSSPMIRRAGRDGPFWGCPAYPKCRGTRRISQ